MEFGEGAEQSPFVGGRLRKIIHIDMDAFYASVEQRDNPELCGKPVAVGGSRERGVVAAASYEARQFGVHSAMPSITAKRKCPDLIFVKPRFDAYKAISLQIREIFAAYTPIIEPLSLDEAYLDVTENLKGISLATQIAEEIRARIRAETELTADRPARQRGGALSRGARSGDRGAARPRCIGKIPANRSQTIVLDIQQRPALQPGAEPSVECSADNPIMIDAESSSPPGLADHRDERTANG
jgi:hypothetical protein